MGGAGPTGATGRLGGKDGRKDTTGGKNGRPWTGGAGPAGAAGRRGGKDGRKDTTGDADSSKGGPGGERKGLSERRSAAGRVISGFAEGQGAKKANGRVKKRESIGSGNVRGRVWGSNGVEQDTGTEVDGTVIVAGKAMPK
jgi:hypothetical protein